MALHTMSPMRSLQGETRESLSSSSTKSHTRGTKVVRSTGSGHPPPAVVNTASPEEHIVVEEATLQG
eukprot:gene15842-11337_t